MCILKLSVFTDLLLADYLVNFVVGFVHGKFYVRMSSQH